MFFSSHRGQVVGELLTIEEDVHMGFEDYIQDLFYQSGS